MHHCHAAGDIKSIQGACTVFVGRSVVTELMTKQDKLSVCLGALPQLDRVMGRCNGKRGEEQTRNHIAEKNTSFYRPHLESCWICCTQCDLTLITTSMSRQDNLCANVSRWVYVGVFVPQGPIVRL